MHAAQTGPDCLKVIRMSTQCLHRVERQALWQEHAAACKADHAAEYIDQVSEVSLGACLWKELELREEVQDIPSSCSYRVGLSTTRQAGALPVASQIHKQNLPGRKSLQWFAQISNWASLQR